MNYMKTFISILAFILMTSCGSLQVTMGSADYGSANYGFNHYDYNVINRLYLTNPNYFYNTMYVDQYGIRRYYYNHPYFVRYCNTRRITPNRSHYIRTPYVTRGVSNNRHITPKAKYRTTPKAKYRTHSVKRRN